jgi:integrase
MMAEKPKFPMTVRRGSCVVKIYRDRRPSGEYFRVIYYLGGKRHRLVFSSLADAKAEADAKASQLARGDIDAAQLSGQDRLIYGRALEAIRYLEIPLDAAALEYADARKSLGDYTLLEAVRFFVRHRGNGVQRISVSNAVQEFLTAKASKGLTRVYQDDLRNRLRSFEKCFHCDLNQITSEDVRSFLSQLKVAARTHNNFIRTLKTFFRFAQTRGWISKELDLLEGIEDRKETPKPVEIFESWEMEKLLAVCTPDLAACLALVGFAGVRMEEILRMSWEDIYRRKEFVEIEAQKAKTARRRLVPISSNLADWLVVAGKSSGRLWPWSKAYFFEAIPNAARLAGIKWKRNALRHSFISYRLAQTQNKHLVAEEAGNSPRMIDSHYRELVTPEQAQDWFGIHPAAKKNKVIAIGRNAA